MNENQIIGFLNNDDYRIKAQNLFNKLNESYEYIKQHKPSLGNFGEYILRDFLKKVLPKEVDVSQGFVQGKNNELSPQCDIIIYIKDREAILKSFGDIHIISSKYVLSIIEVKTRIQHKTFMSTLKAFEKLAKLGCSNNYIFIYNAISPQTLCSYFYPINKKCEDFIIGDNGKYDHGNQYYLPLAICNLQSNYYLCQDYIINESDQFGYLAYQLTDNNNVISSLQMFIGAIINICPINTKDSYKVDDLSLSFNNLSVLYSHSLWKL